MASAFKTVRWGRHHRPRLVVRGDNQRRLNNAAPLPGFRWPGFLYRLKFAPLERFSMPQLKPN
jgi:hypothetical protein